MSGIGEFRKVEISKHCVSVNFEPAENIGGGNLGGNLGEPGEPGRVGDDVSA